MKTEIIYEDDNLWVIYKPAGLATQSAKVSQPDVVSELTKVVKGGYVGLLHRLDQPVEGLLVVAKDKMAAASLSKQLTGGTLNKYYYAAVMEAGEGDVKGAERLQECGQKIKLTDYLQKDAKSRLSNVVTEKYQGKKDLPKDVQKAVLEYELLDSKCKDEKKIALAHVCLETGRFHQIRAQMAHANLPLLGDLKYAPEDVTAYAKKWQVSTVALCAYKVEFLHPQTKKKMTFTCQPKGIIFHEFTHTI